MLVRSNNLCWRLGASGIPLVASHPMAGTAQAGVEAGVVDLFRGRPWIATPDAATDPAALAQVRDLAVSVGGHWLTSTASQHDQAVALISHMPVLVSAALLRAVGDERDPEIRQLAMVLASSGFADTSRVGGNNPEQGVAMASPPIGMRCCVAWRLTAGAWSSSKMLCFSKTGPSWSWNCAELRPFARIF